MVRRNKISVGYLQLQGLMVVPALAIFMAGDCVFRHTAWDFSIEGLAGGQSALRLV
jgi:hypothetical protein